MSYDRPEEDIIMGEYQISEVYLPDGRKVWTVVEFVDGVYTGGDAHWLTREGAVIARDHYVEGRFLHPDAPRRLA